MRKLFTVLVMVFAVSFAFASANYNGTSSAKINLQTANGVDSYLSIDNFNGNDQGIKTSGSYFHIKAAEAWVNKNNGSDITGGNFYYRIYKQGSTAGSFTSFSFSWIEENGSGTVYQKWGNYGVDIDILAEVNSTGTWIFECYWDAPTNGVDCTNPIFLNNSGNNYSFTFTADATLPIELTTFTAKKQGNTTQLNWATSSEENNDFFTIEKSLDGENFKAIGTKAGAGNSLEAREYSFIDAKPANGTNYYRLKQTDFDGKFTYSEVVSVDFKISIQATIYPNPTSEKLTINTEIQDVVNIRIFNVNGQVVYQNTQRIDNQTDINLSELAAGNYFLIIANDATQATIYSSSFVKD